MKVWSSNKEAPARVVRAERPGTDDGQPGGVVVVNAVGRVVTRT